jgi:hypothetical protein
MGPRFLGDDAEGFGNFAAQANAYSSRAVLKSSNPEKTGEFVTGCALSSAGEVG